MNPFIRRQRRRRQLWALALIPLAALALADHRGWLLVRGPDDMTVYHGAAARVIRVIDARTLEVAIRDRRNGRPTTQVRLWGVLGPRPAGRGRPAESLAGNAANLVRELAAGRTAILRLEAHRTRAAWGRVLAHVELPGGASLNEALLAAGLGRADERYPHALLGRYERLERAARRAGAGVWGQ